METIKDILFNLVVVIFYVFQFYTLFLVYYLSIISIFGVLPFDFTKKQKQKEKEIELNAPKYHRFCLVASAHNEEIVI
ncbi:MAG: hypothetical protein N2485_08710, partial [bacterium]|nr:hypothetical protein [bacterium]